MSNTFVGMPRFPEAARVALADTQLRRNLAHATSVIRTKRNEVVGELDDWQDLRRAGAAIKDRALRHLDRYLEQFEATATAAGARVHWAGDGDDANAVVIDLVRQAGAEEVVKVKSMATQETGMNEALASAGITALETDLAELIVQLNNDLPSHVLVPAIHRNRAEIREIFLREMPDAPRDLTDDPRELAAAARRYLRRKFMSTKVGISGANFAVAETGTLVVVESEGNGRMCLTLPETLITVVGVEKILPMWTDLEVFLQLLPRSSTGERMNPYTTMWTGITDDGPRVMHIVLVDNGRSRALADPVGRQALRCIRCSACMNFCPVYERTGGHAYASVYPGPIGAILNPLLNGVDAGPVEKALPYASSLCGRCLEVCPVAIDIPDVLVHLRGKVVDAARERRLPDSELLGMRAAGWILARPGRLAALQRMAGFCRRLLGQRTSLGPIPLPGPVAKWSRARDIPMPPRESFRAWWQRTHGSSTSQARGVDQANGPGREVS